MVGACGSHSFPKNGSTSNRTLRSGSRDGTSAERWRSSGAHDVVKRSPCRAVRAAAEFIEFLRAGSRLQQHGGANMFEEIFFPKTAEKYRAAPLVDQRARYLVHLKETGARRPTLRKCASDQLSLVRLLNLQKEDRVSSDQLEAAAKNWCRPKGVGAAGRRHPRRERASSLAE